MTNKILHLSFSAARFRKKSFLNQTVIIFLLAAVITGSLLTGYSVRESLRRSASVKLGNTGLLISSGERYLAPSLADRISESTGIQCTGFLEMKGFTQILSSQKKALNTNIFAVNGDFFSFQGSGSITIKTGEVVINRKLADFLEASPGDELIIHYKEISGVPAGAPFAPTEETGRMVVKKIGRILEPSKSGNYSLTISQMEPMNIFIGISDIVQAGNKTRINRLALHNNGKLKTEEISAALKKILQPEDLGLNLRTVPRTGTAEIVSDRIFIDIRNIEALKKAIPSSYPVLTYLGNSFKKGKRSAPYSFVSALPSSLYRDIPSGSGMIISSWLAEDLAAVTGDTILMSWFSPDSLNNLVERSENFKVTGIAGKESIWSDSLLMPSFPGIVDSKSCSDWDAGVLIKLSEIRQKDEEYWNKFRGTPKAFISYEKGKEIWGNNFGPATALRYPEGIQAQEIRDEMRGKIDPVDFGLSITDPFADSLKAADESVDFGSLFLSLGFFLIVASLILLSFTISSYLDSKTGEIRTLYGLGFKNRIIGRLMFLELSIMALPGSIAGAFGGFFINILITLALNSVWQGAVQTDTLNSFFSISNIVIGFLVTIIPVTLIAAFKIRGTLRRMNLNETALYSHSSNRKWTIALIFSGILTIGLFSLSLIFPGQKVVLSFISGGLMFITLILLFRYLIIRSVFAGNVKDGNSANPSVPYYAFHPSHALTPALFIAAGLFAVFITGANRAGTDTSQLKTSGGTGGYLLWCESSLPVMDNLNTRAGLIAAGLDVPELEDMSFIQAKRSAGNDASCLNLNHISVPPILGLDPGKFIGKGAFSFSGTLKEPIVQNGWQYLNISGSNNIIYGIADQTVLEWGLKIGIGDTLILRAENGEPLKIVISGALKSSVFQGNVIIGMNNFVKYFPSVSGSNVILAEGKPELAESYRAIISERLENNGVNVEITSDRLASFNEVTNTYLSVFMVLGGLGMITGIVGLGFILMRNYNLRRREFALMLATGFTLARIRKMIIWEQLIILIAGLTTGFFSAVIATLPSVSGSSEVPWTLLLAMLFSIVLVGLVALFVSAKYVTSSSLTSSLRKE